MFYYFGYGSNMEATSLLAKGVAPLASVRAELPGWRLRFNVTHFFEHEGGVGNIEPSTDTSDRVLGVLHRCEESALVPLDASEACGHGYDRIKVEVLTEEGPVLAWAYVGTPAFIDDACLPTRRYLNILIKGAVSAGLDPEYVEALRNHPILSPMPVPPFQPPAGDYPAFDAESLAKAPCLTALAGAVFDMSRARWKHEFLKGFFGGRDMTLFHLKRMDSSDGSETLDDIRAGRFTPAQRRYLDEYLFQYLREYDYAGTFVYPDQMPAT